MASAWPFPCGSECFDLTWSTLTDMVDSYRSHNSRTGKLTNGVPYWKGTWRCQTCKWYYLGWIWACQLWCSPESYCLDPLRIIFCNSKDPYVASRWSVNRTNWIKGPGVNSQVVDRQCSSTVGARILLPRAGMLNIFKQIKNQLQWSTSNNQDAQFVWKVSSLLMLIIFTCMDVLENFGHFITCDASEGCLIESSPE